MQPSADTLVVELSVSCDLPGDEAADAVQDELAELRTDLSVLAGVAGPVSTVADTSEPDRQGGELLRFLMEMAAPTLESLLILIKARRERRHQPEAAGELRITLRVIGPSGTSEVLVEGGDALAALPSAAAILQQISPPTTS